MSDTQVSGTPILDVQSATQEGLLADRHKFWLWFTGLITTAVIGLAILLIGMWVFLV